METIKFQELTVEEQLNIDGGSFIRTIPILVFLTAEMISDTWNY